MSSLKKIDAASGAACHNSLSIFGVPPTNVSINKSVMREILPLNSIEESPFEFRVFSDNHWVDLSKTFVYLELSMQKQQTLNDDWVNIEADDLVAPIQSIGQSFIRQLKLQVNGSEIYDSTNLYPYLSYIRTELFSSTNVKDSVLEASGYRRETRRMASFTERNEMMNGGRVCEFISRLEFDLANQNLFLLNNLDLLFTMYRADDHFLIHSMTPHDTALYRIRLHSIKLYVKTIDVQSSLNVGVLNMLEKTSAKYPLRKTEIRSCFLTPGRTELTYNVFTNIVPKRIIIGFVDNAAYSGNKSLDPFVFSPFNIREVTINAGGLTYPAIPYNMRFNESRPSFIRAFMDMHLGCSTAENMTNGITLDRFLNGCAFFIIPLCATMDECPGFELIRSGTTTIHLLFNEPVPAPGVTMIAIGEFDQLLSIDQNRVILTDGTV